MKKILIIGAIALVVVGCVLAAGCISTNDDNVNQLSGFIKVADGEPQNGGAAVVLARLEAGVDEDTALFYALVAGSQSTDGYKVARVT